MHPAVRLSIALVLFGGCSGGLEPAPQEVTDTPVPAIRPDVSTGAVVLTHGGQGSPASRSDGPAAAAEAAWTALAAGSERRDAAIEAIAILEDDPRFNAGKGANLRLDGETIQCDAAIMDVDDAGQPRFGAVSGLSGVRSPVRLARAVTDTPHLFLAGEGARAFAERRGAELSPLETPQARAKLERGWTRLFEGRYATWKGFDWRAAWNYEVAPPADLDAALALARGEEGASGGDTETGEQGDDAETKDTVGVVLRTADGDYVAALSTGGTTLALRGRVGDVPQLGAGLFAGPFGAVAATGRGEAIVRERVAARVYDLMADGVAPRRAIELATRDIGADEGVGVIAVSRLGHAAAATSQMAWAARTEDGLERADHVVTH